MHHSQTSLWKASWESFQTRFLHDFDVRVRLNNRNHQAMEPSEDSAEEVNPEETGI